MATAQPQTRESTSSRIERALLADIAAGGIGPGARLDEASLAHRFGCSRTPVREAVSRLLAQGVLVSAGRRGVQVRQYSRQELAQMFEAMHEIEAVCARMAAQRLTLLARAEIEAAQVECVRCAEKGDLQAYLHANEAFHLAIYRATGNPYICELATDFRRRTGPFRAKKFASHGDLMASAESHRELLTCIFSADSDAATEGMRAHMTRSFMAALSAIN